MSPLLKKIMTFSVVIIVLALIIYPKLKVDKKEGKGSTIATSKSATPPPLAISILPIEKSNLDISIRSVGNVLANQEVTLRSETSGKIIKINFKEGTIVHKGQLLVKINDADLQAELKKITYKLKLINDNETRQKTLLDKGGISQVELDGAINETNITNADLELLKAKIDKTEIRAPFTGIVGLQNLSVGAYISPTNEITILQDIGKVKLDFYISEKYAGQLKIGQKITFKVQGISKEFEGEIYAKSPRIDETTRTLQVKATASNKQNLLLPGAFADIYLNFDKSNDAIMVPTEAVIPDMKGHTVYLYKNGIALLTPIVLGVRKEKLIQILEGITVGDTLITSGILQLKPNAPVKIKKSKV